MQKNIFSSKKAEDTKYLFIILFVAIIAFWQVAFLQNVLKWDFLSITVPWRYFISENIRNGFIPLWSPYAKLGFPLYFDPQTWYPISWLISALFSYNIYTIHLEFIFHILLSGVGVYYFSSHFIEEKKIRLISAIIVMLSGFSVGNAQHMGWIVSATWIPFLFNSYLNIYKKKNLIPVFSTIIFASLLLSGGYFPFFLTSIYTIFVIFTIKTITFFKQKDFLSLKQQAIKHLFLGIIFTLVNLVVLFSLLEARKYIPRGSELSIIKALKQSIELKGLITFIFPFTNTFGDSIFWGDEKTVMNSYFGIFSFLILVFGIFLKKSKSQKIFFWIGLLAFMTAMGHSFPFRKIFYYILPFFKYFRFPSLFRYFGILSFSIFVGITLSKILKTHSLVKYFRKFLLFIFLCFTVLIIILSIKFGFISSMKIWFTNQNSLNFYQTILIQSCFHVILLSVIITVLFFTKNQKNRNNIILIIFILDMILSVQMNTKETIISVFNPQEIQKKLQKLPKGFPIPDLNEKIINNNDKSGNMNPLWRNTNYYHKKVAFDGYGPYQLNNFTELENSFFFHSILENNLFFFGKNFQTYNKIDTNFVLSNPEGIVFTNDLKLTKQNFSNQNNNKITIQRFNPKDVVLEVRCEKKSFLVFMQNYFPAWSAYIDGKKSKIYQVNYSLQGIIVDEGTHKIEFKFENKKIIFTFYISFFFFLMIIISIIFLKIKQNKLFLKRR